MSDQAVIAEVASGDVIADGALAFEEVASYVASISRGF
jgi:hypothetical protein